MARYILRAPHVIEGGLRDIGAIVGDGPTDIPFLLNPTPYMAALDDDGQTKLDAVMQNHFGGQDLPGFVMLPQLPLAASTPFNIDVPYVSQEGDLLNSTMGNWTGVPTAYAYQWQMDGVNAGTDSSSYVIIGADVGHTATCIVTATNGFGSTAAPPSNGVVVVAPVGTQGAATAAAPKPKSERR